MALTLVKQKEGVAGDLRYWAGTITFDSSYNTGGEAIAAADFGFGQVIYVLELGRNVGIMFEWDKTNGKIMAVFPTGGATAATSVTAPTSTLSSGNSAISAPGVTALNVLVAGAGKEVGSTANLATVVIQAFAMGQ